MMVMAKKIRVLQQVTLPSFGMMCLNSQLTVHIRIFSLSFPLCEWFSSTPFLSLVYYIYYIYSKQVKVVG